MSEKVWRVSLTMRGADPSNYHMYRQETVIARDASAAYSKVNYQLDGRTKREAYISQVELIAEASV